MGLTLLALTMVAVIGFALLALFAARNGSQLISAFLATGMWLFLASSVLIGLVAGKPVAKSGTRKKKAC